MSSSLSTVADADAYFARKLHVKAWTTSDKQQLALDEATLILDRLNYKGWKTSSTQEHEWPRDGLFMNHAALDKNVIPEDILFAQYEIALALLKGVDPEMEQRSLRILSRGYSSVRTTYDSKLVPEYLLAGVPSSVGWAYLAPYLNRDTAGSVVLHRVS